MSDFFQGSGYDGRGAAIGGNKGEVHVQDEEPAGPWPVRIPSGGIPYQLYGPRHLDPIGPPGSQTEQPTPTTRTRL